MDSGKRLQVVVLLALVVGGGFTRGLLAMGKNKPSWQLSSLQQAVKDNDSVAVANALEKDDIDVDEKDSFGNTLLHIACKNNNLEIVKLLVGKGANPLLFNKNDKRAKDLAIPSSEVFLYLDNLMNQDSVDKEDDLNQLTDNESVDSSNDLKSESPISVISSVLQRVNSDISDVTVSYDSSVEKRNNAATTIQAVWRSYKARKDISEQMLAVCNVMEAIKAQDSVKFNETLALCPDCTLLIGGFSVLHIAAIFGTPEMLEAILDKNPELLEVQDPRGKTALHWATIKNKIENVNFLLRRDADTDAVTSSGNSLILMAVGTGNIDLIRLFINKDVVNFKGDHGITPLILAISQRNNIGVRFLIENGANPNISDKNGFTALHWAVCMANLEIFKLLMDKFQVMSRFQGLAGMVNNQGDTALDLAYYGLEHDGDNAVIYQEIIDLLD